MKSNILTLLFLSVLSAGGMAQQLVKPVPILTEGSSNSWALDWYGVSGYSYFIQYSLDLEKWRYFGAMETGANQPISYGFSSAADRFFVRLKYTDQTGGDTADFDQDGLTNYAETNIYQTDPLLADTDGDGENDGLEIANGTDPNDPLVNSGSGGGGGGGGDEDEPLAIVVGQHELALAADTEIYPSNDSALLLQNGDFSEPEMTAGKDWPDNPDRTFRDPQPEPMQWEAFIPTESTGWRPVFGTGMEYQIMQTTWHGQQICELDAHKEDDEDPASPFSHGIVQTVNLKRGNYLLFVDYRGRYEQWAQSASFKVKIKREQSPELDVEIAEITAPGSLTQWQRAMLSFEVKGGDAGTEEFPAELILDSDDPEQGGDGVGPRVDNVILLPVELKQLNYPKSTDSTDMGQTESKVIGADQIAYITGAPEMPKLEISIGGGSLAGMTVEWKMEVKSERTERGTKDDKNYPSSGYKSLPSNQPWKIHEEFGSDFVAGKAKIFFKINGGSEITLEFKIRGKNPKDADAKGHIQNAMSAYRFAWAIAQHECRSGSRVYNQFNPSGSLKELPFFGAPDGWGLFQIDRSSDTGGFTTTEETYSWHVNCDAGLGKLNQKRSDAERFIRWIRNLWGSDSRWEEPPANWTVSSSSFTPIELATMVLYNGANGVPWSSGKNDSGGNASFRSPWVFDPTKPSGQRWTFHDNTNPVSGIHYATTVIEDEWESSKPVVE